MMMRQSQQEATEHLINWANRRYGLGWTPDSIKQLTPKKAQETLIEASKKFFDEKRLEKAIETAQAIPTDAALEEHLQKEYGVGMTDAMRYLEGQERSDAIRSRIENILRAELLHLERTILLDTLDQTWKDHLYAMDQLRDSISYRAYSQQDPRIEYKREGSRMFHQMLETVRDQVTDYVFKARLTPAPPQAQRQAAPFPPAARPPAAARPVRAGGSPTPSQILGSSISGPGFDRAG